MIIRDKISVDVPYQWQWDENGDSVSIYNNNGQGAITMSFYKILERNNSIIEYISEKAVSFINQNGMKLDNPFIIDAVNEEKILLSGIGVSNNNWIIKLYILTNKSEFILITYHTKNKSKEIKIVDKIVESITFI